MIRKMGGIRREFMISNKGKAEALAQTFVRVNSSGNLTPGARAARDEVLRAHPNIYRNIGRKMILIEH